MFSKAFVTGASSGIGRATARALSERGYQVIGAMRDPESLSQNNRIKGVEYVSLDLADRASVERVAPLLADVDILVNCAGEATAGPLEELPYDMLERTFQVNVLAPVRLTQLALPGMRERRRGRVIMIGSMIASFPVAYRSSYVAVKAAMKGFATAARGELAQFGVYLSTVEPSGVNTGIGQRRQIYVAEGSPYRRDLDSVIAAQLQHEEGGVSAEMVAQSILMAIGAHKPKPIYTVGRNAGLILALKRIATDERIEKIIARKYGITI